MRGGRRTNWLRRERRTWAVLGALLYVLGSVALPSLHVATHRADHDHAGGGLNHRPAHAHPAHAHTDGAAHTDAPPAPRPDAVQALHSPGHSSLRKARLLTGAASQTPLPDLQHGQGSLVHYASASLPLPAPLFSFSSGRLLEQLAELPPRSLLPQQPLRRAQGARAPPATLVS